MEALTSAINVQVDAKDKELATKILKDLGLNMSTYINMAIKQVIKRDGVPFEIVEPKPSKRLLQALKELDDVESGKKELIGYNNMTDLINALEKD